MIFVDPAAPDENSGDAKGRPRRGGSLRDLAVSKSGKDLLKNLYNDPQQNVTKPSS